MRFYEDEHYYCRQCGKWYHKSELRAGKGERFFCPIHGIQVRYTPRHKNAVKWHQRQGTKYVDPDKYLRSDRYDLNVIPE